MTIVGFGMDLIALKAAQMWIRDSRSLATVSLPTPLQFGMALKSASSPGIGPVFSYFGYLFSRSRSTIPRFVSLLTTIMVAQVIVGLATAATDIWLHLTSTSVQRSQVVPLSTPSSSYSRQLFPNCTSGPLSYAGQQSAEFPETCALENAATNTWIV